MKDIFPQLSEDILFGVRVHGDVKKVSWSFTLRNAKIEYSYDKAPGHFEFLKSPNYTIAVYCQSERSKSIINNFVSFISSNQSIYTPVLGLHNCPAILRNILPGTFTKVKGPFETNSFVTEKHKVISIPENEHIRLNFDKVPTYQDNNFWNPPDKYVNIIYSSDENFLSISDGIYYQFSSDESKWVLI